MGLRSLATTLGLGLGCLGTIAATSAAAQETAGAAAGARLVFLATAADEGRPGAASDDLKVLSLADLPKEGEAQMEVLGALLRSNPVSTFVSTPDAGGGAAQTGDLHLVADIALTRSGGDAATGAATAVSLGGEAMSLEAFGQRLGALVAAFNTEAPQIAYVRIDDPEDLFAGALTPLRSAIEPAGFGMTILMVGAQAGACEGDRAPVHYSLLGGIADSAPFGDGDGATSIREATDWVAGALERAVARGEPCAARYSLILRGETDASRAVVRHGAAPVFPDMETAVYRERFEALFLMSAEDEAPIRDYLQTCTYCPSEAALSDRLREIGERQLALSLETGIWNEIRNDNDGGRIGVYLENCQLCAYRQEAEAMIERFAEIEAARDAEADDFRTLAASQDLAGLRDWVDGCVACEQIDEAKQMIATLEADSRVDEEAAALRQAVASRNADRIRDWRDDCEICAADREAEAALAKLAEEAEAAGPCLSAAGLPQQGGPRLLEGIDQTAARALCGAALTAHPGNPLAVTALGRIEQAAGNMTEARAAYDAGIEAGIPAAFGLAAHSFYAPGDGSLADYQQAERLAVEGRARGDWLSGEVLTVLYSRDLIDGKSAEDAYEIARAHAEDGNAVAQFFTGYFHRIGAGVERSDQAAVDWLGLSVEQGYVHANSFLAEIYETGGDGVPEDGARATELYWAALAAGDPTAVDRLANQVNNRSGDVIAGLQSRLRDAGIYAGAVDGIGGNATATAVRRFAQSVTETP